MAEDPAGILGYVGGLKCLGGDGLRCSSGDSDVQDGFDNRDDVSPEVGAPC